MPDAPLSVGKCRLCGISPGAAAQPFSGVLVRPVLFGRSPDSRIFLYPLERSDRFGAGFGRGVGRAPQSAGSPRSTCGGKETSGADILGGSSARGVGGCRRVGVP